MIGRFVSNFEAFSEYLNFKAQQMRQTCPTGPHQGLKPGKKIWKLCSITISQILFRARDSKSAQLTNFNKNLGHSKRFFHDFFMFLKLFDYFTSQTMTSDFLTICIYVSLVSRWREVYSFWGI